MSVADPQPPFDEEEIFQAAAALPAMERAAYLTIACDGQPALRARVEGLLASHDQDDFMQRPADRADSPRLQAELARLKPEESEDRIGHYRLIQEIGEGGFGTVWLAEQLEPVRRKVALKIIKLGMDTKEVIGRFEQERQALALMDHPNIAKVLDAGATPLGRLFFVMELVQGLRITDFCAEQDLPTSERLELFIAVCNAIQHAHQKGIIHRDIKPSNILVTRHDGVPVPKVIDFGVAKAIQSQQLTELTFITRFEQMIGTPVYMSPEQAEMGGLDIDTRSDIYSLGVVLYELLTDKTPFDAKELMALGLDAIRKTIRETEPLRPSTQLTRELVADGVSRHLSNEGLTIPSATGASAGSRRRLELKDRISRLRGDLDWIVMKCLEKERSRRYATANGLAADLKRYLNSEPVVARPPSAAYLLRKAWRRNELAFTAAGAVATALVIGIGVSLWQASEASRARDAEREQSLAALRERDKARIAQTEAEHHLYAANMNLARQAWQEGSFGRLQRLLEETRAFPERGFEWYYWQRQAHLNLLTLRGHVAKVRSAAFSRDGRYMVTASEDQTARVWDADSGRQLFWLIGHNSHVYSAAFSPDGQRIVTGSADQTARVWDVTDRREVFLLEGHGSWVKWVAYSQDGQLIATASADHTARIWDASTGRLLHLLTGHTAPVNSVAFSPDGRRIVTGSEDKTARLWDTNDGNELVILPAHSIVLSVAFSPNGERIASGHANSSVQFWDASSGRQFPLILSGTGPIGSVVYSPDGKRIATGSWDQTAMVWDVASGAGLFRLLGHNYGINSVAFSPEGQRIVTAADETAKIWEASGDRELLTLRGTTLGTLAVAISPDNQRIVTGGSGLVDEVQGSNLPINPESAEVWETATGKKAATLTGHPSGISCAAFSPDGLWIITGGQEQAVRVWEAAMGQEIWQLDGHEGGVNSVAFSPDGLRIVTGGRDHKAKVWDVAQRRLLFEMSGHTDSVTSVGFSRDGKRIVTGSLDNTARVWEADAGRDLFTFTSPWLTRILSVAFSPDGGSVIGGGYIGAVVWNLATRVEIPLLGDNSPVSSVAFSPDGKRIITGSYGGVARLWEARTGRELLTFTGHGRVGASVAFSHDGLRIVTGSIDLPSRVWKAAEPGQVAAWELEDKAAAESKAIWQQELADQLRKQAAGEYRR